MGKSFADISITPETNTHLQNTVTQIHTARHNRKWSYETTETLTSHIQYSIDAFKFFKQRQKKQKQREHVCFELLNLNDSVQHSI